MKHLTLIAFIFIAAMNLHCSRVSNSLSQLTLDCGDDADYSKSYAKIFDPDGNPVKGEDIFAQDLHSQTGIPVTERGCVAYKEEAPLVVKTRLPSRNWGAVLSPETVSWARIALQDVAGADLSLSCAANPFTQGDFLLDLSFNLDPKLLRAFPLQVEIIQNGQRFEVSKAFANSLPLHLPTETQEGAFEVALTYRNLFQVTDPRLIEKTCKYVLDRKAPELANSMTQLRKSGRPAVNGLIQVRPGEQITIESLDQNAETPFVCLRPFDSSDRCQAPEAFQPISKLQAPESEKWCLLSYALDRAGNRSNQEQVCFIVWQETLLEQIKTLSESARLTADRDQFGSALKALNSLRLFESLPTDEEKNLVYPSIFESLVETNVHLFERNQFALDREPIAIELIGNNWITVDEREITLWDGKGDAKDKYLILGSHGTQVSVKGQKIALGTKNYLEILEVVNDRFVRVQSEMWPPEFTFGTIAWNPKFDEFIATNTFGGPGGVIYSFQDGRYLETARLPQAYSDHVFWSPSGRYLFATLSGTLSLWKRKAKNSFEQLGLISSEGDQIEVRSAAFLRDDGRDEGIPQLYFVGNSGKLFRWSVSKRTRPILLDNFISRPAETWLQMMPRIRQKDSDSFWLLGINELSIISTDDQLTTHSLEVISPLPAFLRDWSWSKDDKSITLLTDQSKVGYKEYPNADFLRTGVVNLERNQFSSMIHHPLFDVTIDRNHYARIWHQKDALGSFVVSNREAYRMDWLDENRIGVVSGDDSAALWSRDGQLIQRFRNEGIQGLLYFIWNETKDRFVTIGKDDDIHVWAVDGTYLQRLPDPDQGEAFDVESSPSVAVFASDQRTIITSGQINFTIWRLGDDQQYQIAKKISGRHPLDHDFVEPSQLKVFSWKGKDVVFASRLIGMPKTIQFFDLEGEPSKLWPDILTTVKNATLSKDGRFLALIDLEGFGAEYELGEAGFQLRGPKFPIEKEIEYMSYSPDGQTLLGFSGNQKLRIWSHEDGHAIPVLNDHSTPLHKGEFDSVTWWPDSEKFVFINGNSVLVLTKKGEILTQFSPSGPNKVITRLSLNGSDLAIMSYAPDEAYYSGKETRSEIKIISFDLNVQKQKLCAAIQNFLSLSNDFDRLPNMNIKDRGLCLNQ